MEDYTSEQEMYAARIAEVRRIDNRAYQPADQDGFTSPQTWDDNGVYMEG